MKVVPSRQTADHFEIHDISRQELRNLLAGIKGEQHWMQNAPWGKWTIESFENALQAAQTYFYGTSW